MNISPLNNIGLIMNPIFIVGVGRSGTSLLQSMLASHSEVSFLPETAFIRRYIVKNKLQKCIAKLGIINAQKMIKEDKVLSRINFEIPTPSENSCSAADFDYYVSLQQYGMTEGGKIRFGDKDPRLIEYLSTLYSYFPNAYVVNIVRDPRDVLSSKKKAAWSAGRSTMFYAFANRVQLRIARNLGSKLFGKRYIEIVYEDLIRDPETQLKSLCFKLELSYEESLLDFGKQAKKLVSKAEESWKKETFGPLLSDNADKWKKQLSLKEVALTELSCSDAFKIGGYNRSGAINNLPLISKLGVYFSYAVITVLTPVYLIFRYFSQKRS
jgi:hypothetical protein